MHLNKDMENESISKTLEAALKEFEAQSNEVPEGYFDAFEAQLMQKIKTQKPASQFAPVYALFAGSKKYLVAASLLLAILTGYLFSTKSENNSIAVAETIQIENLPDDVIEAYVNNNESLAEVEWNTAIENTGASMSLKNN